jgi:hypothetical protein
MKLRTLIVAALLVAAPVVVVPAHAASVQDNISPKGGEKPGTPEKTFPLDRIVTASVHDAWLLSGKNEDTFFDIVQQLATMSAEKRGLTLPESAAAGRRMGNYIKAQAKLDHDQLLYGIVDKAVRMVAKPASTVAAK